MAGGLSKAAIAASRMALRGGGDAGTSVLPRSQKLRRVPHDRLPSMLEYRERLGDFGNRLFGAFSIDDDNVSRAANGKAIVGKIEQARGPIRGHFEARARPLGTSDVENVGVEVGHADERAVDIGGGGIEDVVRGERTIHPVRAEQIRIRYAANDGVVA